MGALAKDFSIGGFVLTRRAAELSPAYAAIANNGRLRMDERIEAAKCAEAMSVALAQPHRGGTGLPLADPLVQFCFAEYYEMGYAVTLRNECLDAGRKYAWESRAERRARGFFVVDSLGDAAPDLTLTEEQIAAKNEAAIMRFSRTNDILRAIRDRLPRRMEMLCVDLMPPHPEDGDILRRGLFALVKHFGLLEPGILRY